MAAQNNKTDEKCCQKLDLKPGVPELLRHPVHRDGHTHTHTYIHTRICTTSKHLLFNVLLQAFNYI